MMAKGMSETGDVSEICAFVQRTTGIQLGEQKHIMVRARLAKRLRALGLPSVTAYLHYLKQPTNGDEITQLIDVLTTNKTSFYRESRHFDLLSQRLELLAERGEEPVIWSAGCSSGEEPYTMSLVALRARVQARILATDISTRVLGMAKAGRYAAEVVADVPKDVQQRYFTKAGAESEVGPAMREQVSFAPLNLLGEWRMRGPFHVIFCRNVMIYFDKTTREKLVGRFHEKLAPGGLLFIGLSESLSGLNHPYRLVEPGVYLR